MSERKPITRKKHFTVDAIIVDWDSNPIHTIEKARDEPNWFNAVVSAMQLERFGYFAIKNNLKSLEKKNKERMLRILEYLHLPQIALFLLGTKKINLGEYKTVIDINKARNDFMHRKAKRFHRGEKAKEIYGPLVNKAIVILRDRLMQNGEDHRE